MTTRSHDPAATARAAVLREAADAAEQTFIHGVTPAASERDEIWDQAVRAVATMLRGMADEEQPGTDEADVDLTDGPVRCPLCPHTVTLHTPNGARAHFTAVHPEQRITGRGPGPWPLLVTDGDEEQPGTEAEAAATLARECTDHAAVILWCADRVRSVDGSEAVQDAADYLHSLSTRAQVDMTPVTDRAAIIRWCAQQIHSMGGDADVERVAEYLDDLATEAADHTTEK